MPIRPGSHELGPDNASLRIKTGRRGAAAKAGHDLLIDVGSWKAVIEAGEGAGGLSIELAADGGSLRVLEGTGGVKALTEEDKAEIRKTIGEEVLEPGPIEFRSTAVEAVDDARLQVTGELSMNGESHPLEFELSADSEGQISGAAIVKQSDWGIKPYTGLFGALKVRDEIEVVAEASLPAYS